MKAEIRRPHAVARGGRETRTTASRDATTWTRLDETAPIVRAAALRLARVERAIDAPWDSRASARIDKALVRFEELTEAGG